VVVGYATGVALGWSKRFSYWGMPILKLIGPVLATAWIPCTFSVVNTEEPAKR
jgi:NitT/TauT family transport system permease protein